MIELLKESLVPLSEVPKLAIIPVRRKGTRLSVSTVWRWALYGQRGVKLESVKVGGQRCTSVDALQRFFSALSQPNSPVSQSTRQLLRDKEVQAKLDQLGI